MVAREVECPICGRTYTSAVARRIIRWALIGAFVGLLGWRLIPRGEGTGDSAPVTQRAG
jgi:hypothetical protein